MFLMIEVHQNVQGRLSIVVRVRGGSSIELEQEANHVGWCGKVACLVEGRAVVNIVVRIFVRVGKQG